MPLWLNVHTLIEYDKISRQPGGCAHIKVIKKEMMSNSRELNFNESTDYVNLMVVAKTVGEMCEPVIVIIIIK